MESQVGWAPERAQSLRSLGSQHELVVESSNGSADEGPHPEDPLNQSNSTHRFQNPN